MGVVLAMGPCFGCGNPFSFNPAKVPSITSPATGTREPICFSCVSRVNPLREKNGLPKIVPLPGAYEACDETELA